MQNKTVVVTGGASGIGKAIAQRFAREGANVVIADLDGGAAAKVADEVNGLGLECDVSREDQIQRVVSEAVAAFGQIDVFVSNAGFAMGQPDHAASASNDVWQRNWDVHVMSHVWATRAVLPDMIARGGGTLINVASAAGLLNQIGDAAYSATKHAAVSFAESLAITHADDGIKVAVVCPQYVATPLLDMDDTTETTPSLIAPADVADALWTGLAEGRFLILPHETVSIYTSLRAAEPNKWLAGMRALRRKFMRESKGADLKDMYKFI